MMEELNAVLDSLEFEEDGYLFIEGVSFEQGDVLLYLKTSIFGNYPAQHWIITGKKAQEHRIISEYATDLSIETAHPLLARYTEPQARLTFYGEPNDYQALIGALYLKHLQLAKDWLPLQAFTNNQMPLEKLLTGRFGLFAHGPITFIQGYADTLNAFGIRTRVTPPDATDDSKARIAEGDAMQLLLIGQSYIIANSFDMQRRLHTSIPSS